MIRSSDFTSTHIQHLTTVTPVWSAEPRSPAAWFDASHPAQIVGQVSLDARSMNVEDHTVRVLKHLIGERDVEV